MGEVIHRHLREKVHSEGPMMNQQLGNTLEGDKKSSNIGGQMPYAPFIHNRLTRAPIGPIHDGPHKCSSTPRSLLRPRDGFTY